MVSAGVPIKFDGVAMLWRGDLVLIVYQLAARLPRTRWLFDRVDEILAHRKENIIALMVILPTADPPDAPTRAENAARMRKLGPALRRLVTTPIGDEFRIRIVRTVMKAIAILQGNSRSHFVRVTIHEGIRCTLQAGGPETPNRSQIVDDLRALHDALGVAMPELEPAIFEART
jgi:hypothetical protein